MDTIVIDSITDSTPWKFRDEPIVINIENFVGFVYQILEKDTGKSYIGYKKFWKKVTKQPLKGRKNKRHSKVESDWRTYNSSCEKLAKKIEENPENYEKVIIRLCSSVSEMKAYEAYIQLEYYINGRWDELYNEMIHLRVRLRKES